MCSQLRGCGKWKRQKEIRGTQTEWGKWGDFSLFAFWCGEGSYLRASVETRKFGNMPPQSSLSQNPSSWLLARPSATDEPVFRFTLSGGFLSNPRECHVWRFWGRERKSVCQGGGKKGKSACVLWCLCLFVQF
jgi:hypothetical protein